MTASRQRPSPQSILSRAGSSAFLVSDLVNIRYLTGVAVSAGMALVLPRKIELFVDGRYTEAAKETAFPSVTVRGVADLEGAMKALRRVAFESRNVTIARMRVWEKKFKNTKFVHTEDVIEEFRRTKAPDELQAITRACKISLDVLRKIPTLLRNGVTEKQLAWQIESLCRAQGASGMAFETIVAFGEHTARPHHRAGDRILKKGDLVQIDMGAMYGGYCSDYSRVFYTAKPTPEQRRVEKAVLSAFRLSKANVKVGADVAMLDTVAREALKKYGLEKEFCHALGHGLGLDIHEGITISKRAKKGTRIKTNEVITIEPGVYLPGKFGMRIEDTVIVR